MIRKFSSFGKITEDEAQTALSILDQMPIQLIPDDLHLRQAAFKWAARLRQKTAYDRFYMAAAEQLGAALWTADQALVNNTRQLGVNWVHWMGEDVT